MKTLTVYTDEENFPGYELRQVGYNQIEIWRDGDHLANYKSKSIGIDAFCEGFFAGMLSAKKD